ncbi:MAG: MDR family MFS transporter [Eggerthellaceae bacterium]|nr:MDR family MFS transporter [Eggerthellaceae bacterium]
MLLVLVSGTFITILNQTLVTPALPSIMNDLSIDASSAQWLTTAFTLVNAIMIPITAYLTDRFSTKSLFIVAMIAFIIGSLLAAWGPNFATLLGGRMIQACGAGVLMPMVMTVMLLTFPVDRRGFAMGLFGIIISFAPAIGPTIAGIIIDNADWHTLFYIVAGLAAIDIVFAIFTLHRGREGDQATPTLDKPSVILSTLGFGAVLYGFGAIGSYGLSVMPFIPIVLGIIILVFFFRRQMHLENPMLRVGILKNRRFMASVVIGMIVNAAIMANGVLIPIYVQDLCGLTATTSAIVMLPGAVVMGIMGIVAGRFFDKHGPRIMGIVGTALLTATTVALSILTTSTSMLYLSIIICLRSFALSLINMPISTWGLNALDNKVLNHGNALSNTLRQVAGSLGTALVISVYSMVAAYNGAELGETQASMIGINVAFAVQAVICLAAMIVVIVMVKDKATDVAQADPSGERRSILASLMKTDLYLLPATATVADAVNVFIEKGVSAVPLVDEDMMVRGIISDGDVIRALSRRGKTYLDPIAMIAASEQDDPDFEHKLDSVMDMPASSIATLGVISIDEHASFDELCRVMGENHLKKVPVLSDGRIVGVINRSDITLYAMKIYMERRANDIAPAVV